MYWFDKELRSQIVRDLMTYRRFRAINKYSCMYSEKGCKETGESDRGSENYDPNFKANMCWKAFLLSAQENMNPSVAMSIDECIIALKVKKRNM